MATNLFKYIGIALGVLVVGVVGSVTALNSKKAPVSSTSDAVSTSSIGNVAANTNSTPTPTFPRSSGVTGTVSRWFYDDDEGDDEGDGSGSAPTTPVTVPPPATVPKNYVALYKDGTYSANGTYNSPGGQDQIAVTLVLKNDIVTDATVTTVVADRTSQKYQDKFIAGFKQYVVGQNISSLKLTVVSGASLTPIGFNDALAKIKANAKV